MTAILNGILSEIASVALLPRNDAGNFKIFVIASEAKQSLGILEFSSLRGFEKKREQSHLLSLERDCFGRFAPSQ